jgi:hypothetical protein
MRGMRRILVVVWSLVASVSLLPVGNAQARGTVCSNALGRASVRGPQSADAWRAEVEARTAVFDRLPSRSLRASRWVAPTDATWLLVLARPRAAHGRCWVQVRLPWRPNDAAGWVNVNNVLLDNNPWRIQVSTPRRTLAL